MIDSNSKVERQTGIEWLRIISMLMIVMGHSIIHGGYNELPLTINGLAAIWMTQGSRIGVDIFVLITGYFSVGKKLSPEKIKRQYFQIWFYSVLITGSAISLGVVPVSLKTIISSIFPVASSQYWFATCYILLLLISPVLQIVIQNISEKQYLNVLFLLFVAWSVVPQLHIGSPGYSNLGWFIFLYLLAAFIKKYPKEWMNRVTVVHGIIVYIVICVLTVLTYKYGFESNFLKENAINLYGEMNMIPAILCALLLFLGFANGKVKQNKIVNTIASCMFGVYLIHDNPNIRSFLWEKVFPCNKYIFDNWYLIKIVFSIICVFCICTVIELIRQMILKRLKRYVSFKSYRKNS